MSVFDPRQASRVLVYGGTFDPPHRAHVLLPAEARAAVEAEGVIYVPAGRPPHKAPSDTPGHHRLAMLKLALAERSDACISELELNRPGRSYTVRTLEALREQIGPGVTMRLLIGADMALIFGQWHRAERVEELAEPVVMLRPPYDREALLESLPADQRDRWARRIVPVSAMDIASTDLREKLHAGRIDDSVRAALPTAVLNYIQNHGLYGLSRCAPEY